MTCVRGKLVGTVGDRRDDGRCGRGRGRVAHQERATVRVGEVFLKIDADQGRIDVEVEAMARAPIPTPEVFWRAPPVLALATVRGRPLGRLGEPSTASSGARAAAGAAVTVLAAAHTRAARRRDGVVR
jgi:hypothetical protein